MAARQLPKYFSQNNPAWKLKILGNGPDNLGNDGCYVSADADAACYFGKDTDPARLDDAFKADSDFSGELLKNDGVLQNIFPDIIYQRSDHYEGSPADLGKLKSYLSDPTLFVILELQVPSGTHFTPAVDTDGINSVLIADVWDGRVKDFTSAYGDPKVKILKYVVYKGVPMASGNGANMYRGLDLNNPDSMKVCVDTWCDVRDGKFVRVEQAQAEIDAATKDLQARLDVANNLVTTAQNALAVYEQQHPDTPPLIVPPPLTSDLPVTDRPSVPATIIPATPSVSTTKPNILTILVSFLSWFFSGRKVTK